MRWLAAAIGVLLAAPAAAPAATIEVAGGVLKVQVPTITGTGSQRNGAVVNPLPDGGAIVGLYGNVPVAFRTVGAGCGVVANSNAPAISDFGGADFAATCNLTGVVGVQGTLNASTGSQLWRSALILPTKVSAVSSPPGTSGAAQEGGDTITTGPGSDTINAGAKNDLIDPGSATYKGQEPVPGTTGEFEDTNRNVVNAGAGDDTITLTFGTQRDVVSGGAGLDGVTYAGRFTIGFPGQAGVNVSLNDVADDGDPSIDPPDSTAPGEGDNVKADVENVTGTKREDVLIGNSSRNRLDGGEAKDTLTGGGAEDALMAREPATAGAGIKHTIDCGSPAASFPPQTFMGQSIGSTSPGDSLDADLVDVPPGTKPPSSCETVTVGPVKEGPNVVVAASATRTAAGKLRVRLRCPRDAGRTCAGTLRLAARNGKGGPKARFSIRRGKTKTVTVALPSGASLARRRTKVRLLAVERGRHGTVTTVAFASA